MILLVLGTEDRRSKEKSLDGRQSAGNCKAAKKTEAPQQAVFTTLVFWNMMKILSALLITSSLNRTELFITNTTSNLKCANNNTLPSWPSFRSTAKHQAVRMKHHAFCS